MYIYIWYRLLAVTPLPFPSLPEKNLPYICGSFGPGTRNIIPCLF